MNEARARNLSRAGARGRPRPRAGRVGKRRISACVQTATAAGHDDADGLTTGESGRLVAKHYYGGANALDTYEDDIGDNGTLEDSHDVVTYQYDAFGRLTDTLQQFDENLDGTIDRERLSENVFDDRGRLSAVKTDVENDATFDQQINYVYDACPIPRNPCSIRVCSVITAD